MLFTGLVTVAIAATAVAKELPKDEVKAALFYDNGLIHQENMQHKIDLHAALKEAGVYESSQYPAIKKEVKCKDGFATAVKGDANQTFACKNVSLRSSLYPHHAKRDIG